MAMDQQIRLLSAIKREVTKIVEKAETKEDKLLLINFGRKRLDELESDLKPAG